MYEKCFSKTIATIATLQVNQLVFRYLSVATRAFSIITYCHTRTKNGGFSAKKQRKTYCFRRKTLKKWRKRLAVSNIFVFCNQQEKFLPIPPRSLRLL